jgi:hypothetical protein
MRAKSSPKEKLILVLLWLGFPALWYRVYTITSMTSVTDSIGYLLGIMSAYGLLLTVWVLHNISIHRRKGPRRGVRMMTYAGPHDALKNYITVKADLKRTQAISINVINGRKIFTEDRGAERNTELGAYAYTS